MKKSLIVFSIAMCFSINAQNIQTNIFQGELQQRQRAEPLYASNVQSNVRQNRLDNNSQNTYQYQNYNLPAQQSFGNNDNNSGEGLENSAGNFINQIASLDIPAIRVGEGNLSLNLNLPKINLKSVKLIGRSSSKSSSKGKSHKFSNKWHKLSRNLTGKLSLEKKLKLKVDKCFKW